MDNAVMFSRQSDMWSTPRAFFLILDAEFRFDLDVAASEDNAMCPEFYSEEFDALRRDWSAYGRRPPTCWCNPPYSKCAEFVAKAAEEARKGVTTVMLIPSRTDTRYWHAHIWDQEKHQPRPGVEVRFLKGRLKFGDGKHSAPFPSVVLVFRPVSPDNARAVNGCNARGF